GTLTNGRAHHHTNTNNEGGKQTVMESLDMSMLRVPDEDQVSPATENQSASPPLSSIASEGGQGGDRQELERKGISVRSALPGGEQEGLGRSPSVLPNGQVAIRKASFHDYVVAALRKSCVTTPTPGSSVSSAQRLASFSEACSEEEYPYVVREVSERIFEDEGLSTTDPQRKTDGRNESDGFVKNLRDEISRLLELVAEKDNDLNMAGMIGQSLLDEKEELNRKLETLQEEKWQAEGELEDLRHRLRDASEMCQQLREESEARSVKENTTEATFAQAHSMWSSGTPRSQNASLTNNTASLAAAEVVTTHEEENEELHRQLIRLGQKNAALE
ncbi:unnamed protein product, partial [Discosporangium mesarthrocarpum]